MTTVQPRPSGANPFEHFLKSAPRGSKRERRPPGVKADYGRRPPAVMSAPAGGDSGDGSGRSGRSGRSGLFNEVIMQVALSGGMAYLSDADLVAIQLGAKGTGEAAVVVAGRLLEKWGGIGALARLGPVKLAREEGVGPIKAMRLLS